METVTLVLPLEATTVKNPSDRRSGSRSDSRGDIRATAGVIEAAAEQQRSNSGLITDQ